MKAAQWSDQEIRFLKENYQKATDEELEVELGRSADAIQQKRSQIGLEKMHQGDITKPSRGLTLSEVEKAYLAGLVDGDGSIFLGYYSYPRYRRSKKPGIHSQISCAIGARSANKEFAIEVKKLFGGRVIKVEENYYEVGIRRQADILQLVEALLPYLRLKRKQAEIMIKFCKERLRDLKDRRNAPYTPKCFELVNEIKMLNTTPMAERNWK